MWRVTLRVSWVNFQKRQSNFIRFCSQPRRRPVQVCQKILYAPVELTDLTCSVQWERNAKNHIWDKALLNTWTYSQAGLELEVSCSPMMGHWILWIVFGVHLDWRVTPTREPQISLKTRTDCRDRGLRGRRFILPAFLLSNRWMELRPRSHDMPTLVRLVACLARIFLRRSSWLLRSSWYCWTWPGNLKRLLKAAAWSSSRFEGLAVMHRNNWD